jgi:tetratricopeptide (TPR) repeat protein
MQSIEPTADPGPGPTLPEAALPPAVSQEERLIQVLSAAGEHEAAGRLNEAEALLGQMLSEAPNYPAALHLSGIVAFRSGRGAEAIEKIERAIASDDRVALFHRNLCEIYRKTGRYDDAVAAGRRSVELNPKDPYGHLNLSVVHYHRLELDSAITCAEKALELDGDLPGAHFGIAESLLLRGDFVRGWQEYEWRFRLRNASPMMPPTDRPQWDGAWLPSGATLLLIADQGYGDCIQFSRYIPWAASLCPEVAVACARELQPLIMQQPGIGLVFDRWEDKPDFAAYCPLSGLPRLAGTLLDTIPAVIPYLRADAGKAAVWAERLQILLPKGWRRIGIVWAGRPNHPNDDTRSIPLAALAPLAEIPGTAFVSLQKGPGQAQIGTYWGRAPLINLGPEITDFGDTMAILDSLDLVVTVDTAIAHLAGAMGKPVWIMLPFAPDWRWLLDRDDSPWYPTARLFRQPAPRRWAPVVASIADEIASTAYVGVTRLAGCHDRNP